MAESTVADIMTTPALTVDPETPFSDVADAMLEERIKSIAVIDDDCNPIGILTSTDFIEVVSDETTIASQTVGDYMTTEIETIRRGRPVEVAAEKMLACGISHLPVMSDGDVVGIVTATDITRHLARGNDSRP